MDFTENVVEFMVANLKKLPRSVQEMLSLAACLGAEFDLRTLTLLAERDGQEIYEDLKKVLKIGLILPLSELDENLQIQTYKFGHDRIQQAAYSLIPELEKQVTHLKIGRLLLKITPNDQQEENIFEIVHQLNHGTDLLTTQVERNRLAELNLKAGCKALASTAYRSAGDYLRIGRELLASNVWEQHYALSLRLYEAAAEAAYLQGDFAVMEQLVEQILHQAKSIFDQIKAYEIKMQAYSSQARLTESLQIALQGLDCLGVHFPNSPTPSDIQLALGGVMAQIQTKTMDELANFPLAQDIAAQSVLRLLGRANAAAFHAAPHLLPLIILKIVSTSIESGYTAESALGYGLYGTLLIMILGDWDTGYQFGQLALKLLEKFNNRPVECRTKFIVNVSLTFCKEHLKNIVQAVQEAYRIGIDNGEIEFAGYSILHHCDHSFFIGAPLPELERKMSAYVSMLEHLKEATSSNILRMFQQATLNLMQRTATPGDLIGEAYDELQDLPNLKLTQNQKGLYIFHFIKLLLNYLFQDFEKACLILESLEKYPDVHRKSNASLPILIFYDSLTHVMMYSQSKEGDKERFLNRIALNQAQMEQWSNHAPMNYRHKWHLVEAERYRVLSNRIEAMEAYDRAIAGAKENEYLQEEALANELAAKFYLDWGKDKIASVYMREAHHCYTHWGAQAKVQDLERRYPQLLPKLDLKTSASMLPPIATATTNSFPTDSLDLNSVLKASQALAQEIRLDIRVPT